MNEPYGRVSRNNGDVTAAITGAAIGTGLVGSGMLGARMHYKNLDNSIDRQAERAMARMDKFGANLGELSQNVVNTGSSFDANPTKQTLRAGIKAENKFDSATKKYNQASEVADKLTAPGYMNSVKGSHMYSKLGGGLKKSAIVAGGAVLGGAIGYGANQMN